MNLSQKLSITFFIFWLSSCTSTRKISDGEDVAKVREQDSGLSIDDVPLPAVEIDETARQPAAMRDSNYPFVPGTPTKQNPPAHGGRGQPGTSSFSRPPEAISSCSPPFALREYGRIPSVQNGMEGYFPVSIGEALLKASLQSGSVTGNRELDRALVAEALKNAGIFDSLGLPASSAFGMAQRFANGQEVNATTARMGAIVAAYIALANEPECLRQVEKMARQTWDASGANANPRIFNDLSEAVTFAAADIQNNRASVVYNQLNDERLAAFNRVRTEKAVAQVQRGSIKRNIASFNNQLIARLNAIPSCKEDINFATLLYGPKTWNFKASTYLNELEVTLNGCYSKISGKLERLQMKEDKDNPRLLEAGAAERKRIEESLGLMIQMRADAEVAQGLKAPEQNADPAFNIEYQKLSTKWAVYGALGGFLRTR